MPLRERLLFGALTTGFWLLWLYLWWPLATLLLWLVGAYLGWTRVVPSIVSGTFWPALANYVLLTLLLTGGLTAWSAWQFVRFRNVERRRPSPPVGVEELAASELTHAGLTTEQIGRWQQARCLLVEHDDAGRVSGARILPEDAGTTVKL